MPLVVTSFAHCIVELIIFLFTGFEGCVFCLYDFVRGGPRSEAPRRGTASSPPAPLGRFRGRRRALLRAASLA